MFYGVSREKNHCARTVIHNERMRTLGDRLKELRKELQLTQGQVAKAVGVSQRAISSLETFPDRHPSASVLHALAVYFQVNPEWFMTGKGERNTVSTLAPEESELLLLYRAISAAGKAYILGRTQEVHRDEHRARPERNPAPRSSPDDPQVKPKRLN